MIVKVDEVALLRRVEEIAELLQGSGLAADLVTWLAGAKYFDALGELLAHQLMASEGQVPLPEGVTEMGSVPVPMATDKAGNPIVH